MDDLCMFLPWSMEEKVWWCFAGDTVCDLFRIQGTLNQHGYHSLLQWYAIPSGFSTGQWPNTPPGCVRAILQEGEWWPGQMTWPPQSHDLIQIEMVWNESNRRLKEKQPTSAQQMSELLQECWKTIPGETGWENPKSLQSCHQGKGWLFEESKI